MVNLIFMFLSLAVLIPVLFILPLGLTHKGKLMLTGSAFFIAILGLLANLSMGIWQVFLVLLLLVLAVTYLLGEKASNILALSDTTGKNVTDFEIYEAYDSDAVVLSEQKTSYRGEGDIFEHSSMPIADSDELRAQESEIEPLKDETADNSESVMELQAIDNLQEKEDLGTDTADHHKEPKSSATEDTLFLEEIEIEPSKDETADDSESTMEIGDVEILQEKNELGIDESPDAQPESESDTEEMSFLEEIEIDLIEETSILEEINRKEGTVTTSSDHASSENHYLSELEEWLNSDAIDFPDVSISHRSSSELDEDMLEDTVSAAVEDIHMDKTQILSEFTAKEDGSLAEEVEKNNQDTQETEEAFSEDELLTSILFDIDAVEGESTQQKEADDKELQSLSELDVQEAVEPEEQPLSVDVLESGIALGEGPDIHNLDHAKISDSSDILAEQELPSISEEEKAELFGEEKINTSEQFAAAANDGETEDFLEETIAHETRPSLNKEILNTMLAQIEMAKNSLDDDQYEALVQEYRNPDLSPEDYFIFSNLLINHYVSTHNIDKLESLLQELKIAYCDYPVVTGQLQYISELYAARI
ncbi:hypothetical protein [Peribacillus sp. SCS-155]|uniref:hypothetical protein n=1 Tax=Peribacillus sedimenti TaxID=3115297 RepID=UPI00390648CA